MAGEQDSRPDENAVKKRIHEAGERAKAEAEARRAANPPSDPVGKESGGRDGPDPARYGDWENKGVVSDF